MHIKLLYRKVLYVFLSLMIIFANTQSAYAASSWNITGAVAAGSRTVVSASKAGYKSAVNVAPTAGRLALKLGKGANWAALLYAAIQLAPDLADIESFQPDYSNNRVKYNIPTLRWSVGGDFTLSDTPLEACRKLAADAGGTVVSVSQPVEYSAGLFNFSCVHTRPDASNRSLTGYNRSSGSREEYIPIPLAAAKVISNANSGHAPSQAATLETATEMVIGGQFDQDLLQGAVPTNDTKPLIPAVPISGNGNQGYGGVGVGDGVDGGMSGATPGQQAADAADAAESSKNSADAAKDAAKAAAEQAAKDAAEAEDLINSGADQAAIDAANDRAKAAEQAAKDAKDVADAAVEAADARAKAAEKAAEKATEAAKEAAEKAAKDVADAKAAGDEAAVAAAEKAKEAADKAVADAKEKQAAAERAADKAKAEAAKPFELPAFCSWASVVCDYTKWVKDEYGNMSRWLKEEPVPSPAELMPIDDDTGGISDIFKNQANAGYVSFQSQCPDNVLIPVSLMGASQTLNISYAGFCHFASLIRPAVILGAWISGLLIISGGRARE